MLQSYNFVYIICTRLQEVRDELILTFPCKSKSTVIELLFQNQKNLLFLCVYRHPHMSINKFNQDHLDKLLSLLSKENKFCIIMGDFSINLSKQNINGAIFDFHYEFMYSSFFTSYILQPTRVAFALWKFCQQSFWLLHTILVIKKFCNGTQKPQQKRNRDIFLTF